MFCIYALPVSYLGGAISAVSLFASSRYVDRIHDPVIEVARFILKLQLTSSARVGAGLRFVAPLAPDFRFADALGKKGQQL